MKNKKRVPELRFKGFNDDWELCKLGSVAEIIGGGTPSTKKTEYWDGDLDWYTPAEIGNQRYLYASQRKITKNGLEKSSAKLLPIGTVLFTSRAGIGNTAILAKEGCTNQGFQSIVPDLGKLDSYFIYSRTLELKRYGETTGAGSTFIEVSGKQMAKMSINLPNISEQNILGTFFKLLDDAITLHQHKLEMLKSLKEAYLQNLFPAKNSKVPALRFANFGEEWELCKLGDYSEMFNGDRSSKYPNETDFISKGIPFINAGDLVNGRVNLATAKKITRKKYEELSGAKLQLGDILYCLRGTLGKNAYIDNFNEGTVASSLVTIRPQNINGEYLYFILNSDIEYKQRIIHDEGAAQPNLSAKNLSKFIIPLSSLREQNKISEYLTNLVNLINLHQQKLDVFSNLKESYLQKMFI